MALRWIPLLDENGDPLLDENSDPILVLADVTTFEGASGARAGADEKPKPDPRLWEVYQEEAARLWRPKPKPKQPEPEPEPEPEPDWAAIAEAARLKRQRDQETLSKLLRKAARR